MGENTENFILDNAERLLNERFRINARDAGDMAEFYRRCYPTLSMVVGELKYQMGEVSRLKEELKTAKKTLAKLSAEGRYAQSDLYDYGGGYQ